VHHLTYNLAHQPKQGSRADTNRPFFRSFFMQTGYQQIIEQTVTGLGLDLVEITRSAGGLLRVTIELPHVVGEPETYVQVEDCERVTRQLQFALEVDAVDYSRLEVSSPGIDRLLRHELDLARFVGEVIDITLKMPIGNVGQVSEQGITVSRRKFRGTLEAIEGVDGAGAQGAAAGWQIVWRDEPKPLKPGAKVSQKKIDAAVQNALGFEWDEIKEARLAPIVNFKGRGN
jgi:ribosome maturation factor RimP